MAIVRTQDGTLVIDAILLAIDSELDRARAKFPNNGDPANTIVGLMEEIGELSEAYLDAFVIAPKYRKGKTYKDVHKEAVQVAVMAIRVALDCGLQDSVHES